MATVGMFLPCLLLGSLYLIDFADGMSQCRMRGSTHCWSAGLNSTVFTCPTRGHHPHPGSPLLYYKCPDAGFQACTCTCRYEGMCFHPLTLHCEFAFLPAIANCTFGAKNNKQTTIGHLGRHPDAVTSSKSKSGAKIGQNSIVSGIDTNGKMIKEIGGTTPPEDHEDMPVLLSNIHKLQRLNEERPHAQRQVSHHSFAARQTASMSGVIKDKVPFPVWAVAIVALSLMVMLVLIIVLMY